MSKFLKVLPQYCGVFYEVVVAGKGAVYRTFDKSKAMDRQHVINTLFGENCAEVVCRLTKQSISHEPTCKPVAVEESVAESEMEVLVSFNGFEVPHIESNARNMRMSVAQYVAVTLFNGAGANPDVVEVTTDGNEFNSRWESKG